MVRVRLEGMTDEVRRIAAAMQAAGCVLERSCEYPNRGGWLAICLSSFFIERWTSLSISIRQAKAFLQLVERHGLKPAGPVILDLLQ